MRHSIRMARRSLRGNVGRLALTVCALAAGVGLVCAIDLVNRALRNAFVEVIDTMAGRAALQITGGASGDSGLFPEDVVNTVRSIDGVEHAVAVVSATAFTTDGSGVTLTVQGIDVADDASVRTYDARGGGGARLEDPLEFLAHPDSVMLTRTFATRRGLRIGERIDLDTPTGVQALTVRGLLEPEGVGRLFGGSLVLLDIYAAQKLFGRPGFVNRIDVVVHRDAEVDNVAAAIARTLPDGLRVEQPAQRKAVLHQLMRWIRVVTPAIGLVGLVAAFLIAFNRLSTVFEARSWEYGVMRAIGVSQRRLWHLLLVEGLLLGVAGVVVGIPLGVALGHVFRPIIAYTTALSLEVVVPEHEVAISPWSLFGATVLGIGTAVLAALVPAWRTARQALVAVIRSRGAEGAPSPRRHMLWVRGGVLAALVGSLLAQGVTRNPAWGLAATGLTAVMIALAARPMLYVAEAFTRRALAELASPMTRFAAAALLANPRRTGLTLGMLGVGLACVVCVATIAASFERSLAASIREASRCDLLITSSHIPAGHVEAPLDDALLSALGRQPNVAAAVGSRVLDWPYRGSPVMVEALDARYFTDPRYGKLPLVGPHDPDVWAALARGDAAVVSNSFALMYGASVGDRLVIETPTGGLPLRIAAVTSFAEGPRGLVVFDRDVFMRHWNDRQVNRVMVQLAPGADLDGVRSAIARTMGKRYGLRILSPSEFVESQLAIAHRAFATLNIVAGLVLLIVLFGLADTLGAGVMDATKQLGTLRALGLRRGLLARMVRLQGLMINGLGLTLALIGGLGLGILWVRTMFPHLVGRIVDLHIPLLTILMCVALSTVVSLAAGVLPARRAAQVDPAVALRCE